MPLLWDVISQIAIIQWRRPILLSSKIVPTLTPKYPPKLMRVGLISNGISYVLEPHMLSRKVNPIWRFGVFKRVGSHEAVRQLMLTSPESVVGGEDDIERAMDWHRLLQGKDLNLTSGIKPEFEHYLGTNFNVPTEAIEELRKARVIQLKDEGYLLDLEDGDEFQSKD